MTEVMHVKVNTAHELIIVSSYPDPSPRSQKLGTTCEKTCQKNFAIESMPRKNCLIRGRFIPKSNKDLNINQIYECEAAGIFIGFPPPHSQNYKNKYHIFKPHDSVLALLHVGVHT